MQNRDGQQKGPQEHAEGQHGDKAHSAFIEGLHGSTAAARSPRARRRRAAMTPTSSAVRSPAIIGCTRIVNSTTKPRRTVKPTGSAADFIPPRPTLPKLRAAASGCRGCHLYK